jgi:hypothetical protein
MSAAEYRSGPGSGRTSRSGRCAACVVTSHPAGGPNATATSSISTRQLLGPVTLKAASVIYRFARYYTGSEPYRRKGPPAPLLRLIGPIIVLLTACVFGSGVMLAVTGPSYGYGGPSGWLVVHRISFFAWIFFIVMHVVAYVPRLPRLLGAEARGVALPEGGTGRNARRAMEVLGGRGTRLALLLASLLAGLVIALLTVHLAGKWEPLG